MWLSDTTLSRVWDSVSGKYVRPCSVKTKQSAWLRMFGDSHYHPIMGKPGTKELANRSWKKLVARVPCWYRTQRPMNSVHQKLCVSTICCVPVLPVTVR